MEKRLDWVDALKGFGIFCVTFGHLGTNIYLEKHIYSFHMFLFFFISGYLFNYTNDIDVKEYIKKKCKSLFVPFMCWNILSLFVGIILSPNVKLQLERFFLINGEVCWNAPIWFLWIIFLTQIIYATLRKYLPHCNLVCIAVSLICFMIFSKEKTFLMLNLLPPAILFYSLGNVLKNNFEIIYNKFYMCLFLLIINICFGVFLNVRISFTGATFGNYLYCILAGIAEVLFYVLIFKKYDKIGNNKLLIYIGKKSMIIMAVQYYLFTVGDVISNKFFNYSLWHAQNTIKAFLFSVITIFIICLCTNLISHIGNKVKTVKKLSALFGI